MPAVLDTPEVMDYETHEIPAAHPQVRPARTGFWRTLVRYISGHRRPQVPPFAVLPSLGVHM